MATQIVTFYSFKGGSGRSQLAANLAAYLCYYEDKKILLIDWDLEAPGLDYFFKIDRKKVTKGVIELFEEYVRVARSGEKLELSQLPKFNEVYNIAKGESKGEKSMGKIDIIPAANFNSEDYIRRINNFDWFDFYERLEGRYYIEYLKQELKKEDYDFIFIDSRTGFSDYLGICNIQLPDINIIVVAPSHQNLDGAYKIATKILEHPYTKENRKNPIVLPLLSRIDLADSDRTPEWTGLFLEKFRVILEDTFISTIGSNFTAEYFIGETTIFYDRELAFGENLKFDKNIKHILPNTIEKNIISIWEFATPKEISHEYLHFINYKPKELVIPRFLTNPPFNNDFFIGRETDLKAIETNYQQNNRLLLLVNGEGGMGKTTLAAKYWYANENRYKHLAWLYAEHGIGAALLNLASSLGVGFASADNETTQIARITETINNLETPCLLVFDNANDATDLERHYSTLRKLSKCHIILTSRVRKMGDLKVYAVRPLAQEEAVQLFRYHYPKLTEAELPLLYDILKAIGYNTLVTEVLAKNLAAFNRFSTQYSLADLLHDLQSKGLLALKNKTVKMIYGSDNLHTTAPSDIISAMHDLSSLSDEERYLLSNLAVLPPDNIPFELLKTLLGVKDDSLDAPLSNLEEKGWIEYRESDSSFKISPVVQETTRVKNEERLLADCRILIKVLIEGLNDDKRHTDNYKQSTIFAHLGETVIHAIPMPDDDVATLCQNIGDFHNDTGNLNQMMAAYEKMLEIQTKLLEIEPNNANFKNGLAISYEKLGETHSNLGDFEKALNLFGVEAELFKDLYTAYPNNVSFKNGLAISYEKLGSTHSNLGDLDNALALFELEATLFKELYESFPNNLSFKNGLAISYSKLGDTHSSMGNLDKALTYFEERNILTKELYEAYPNNISFKNGLAVSYSKLGETQTVLGNLDTALTFFENETTLFKELYAAYPQNVVFKNGLAISYSKLGNTHRSLGNLGKALAFLEQENALALELYENYPNNVMFKNGLAISYSKMGETYSSLGNLDKALTFFEKSISLSEELYSAYPSNISFKNGLAVSYSKLGTFYKDVRNDNWKAKSNYNKAENIWKELVSISPNYIQFKEYLRFIQENIKELTEKENQPLVRQIRNYIAHDDLNSAIELLSDLLKDSPLLDKAILHSARYNGLIKDIRSGIIDYSSANIALNQIRYNILELLEEIIEQKHDDPKIKKEVETYTQKNIVRDSIIKIGGDFHLGDSYFNINQTHSGSGDNVSGDKIIE
jgi:MinD-like ATPase involved in chromosome partitioning or flagellar assembly/Flp pilus assembly protein TadD